ncbi:MAG TPA: hypothetical protein VK142_05840 [Bacillota bacterium]|nr:hypothetical protein [Bacillota bacterium]
MVAYYLYYKNVKTKKFKLGNKDVKFDWLGQSFDCINNYTSPHKLDTLFKDYIWTLLGSRKGIDEFGI